jgi:succinate dehydrogenase / fumarate reductase flavoprotein subunit
VDETARCDLEPFERGAGGDGRGPYQVQQSLQATMQDLVGIVRTEQEMREALERIGQLRDQARAVGVVGNREYNPGWHTALDLANLLIVSEAVTRAAIDRRESRGGHFRDDYPEKDSAAGRFNILVRRGPEGEMQLSREPIPDMPAELKRVIEEQK